ncbi:MAG: hypothetical protein U5R06_16120 [candidate division KSB1 bacterium]|nr:hypothetical protein [candidate division KSB1 bacterium]
MAGFTDNGTPIHVVCGIRGKHFFFAIFASLRELIIEILHAEPREVAEEKIKKQVHMVKQTLNNKMVKFRPTSILSYLKA